MEPKSIQKGIEKRWEKEMQQDSRKSRNKKLQPRHIQTEGLGPWGGRGEGPARVDPSPHSDSGIILHGYHPWISSMDIIHGYLSSMDIIHGWTGQNRPNIDQ